MSKRVLAFDIGIKNLAWCCFEVDPKGTCQIRGWDNYNLLLDSSNVGSGKVKCSSCSAKAIYQSSSGQTCGRHCPVGFPPLKDLSGNLLKKVPSVDVCKRLLTQKGATHLPSKKPSLEEELKKHYSMPIQEKKVSKAPDVGLVAIHDAIRTLVQQQKDLWSTCTTILLENQPVFKNPTMKSVQILLFATLRDILQPIPELKLVHAGKKVKGAKTGDAGYKDRKAGSEARVTQFLTNGKLLEHSRWTSVWQSASKKSDLADALSMCLDFTGISTGINQTEVSTTTA